MKRTFLLMLFVAGTLLAESQPSAPLSNAQTYDLVTRSFQLIDAIGVSAPDTAKPGAALTASARLALQKLRTSVGGNNAALTYEVLTDLKAYLALLDALGRAATYAEQSRKQGGELRENVDRLEAHFEALIAAKERQLRPPDRDNVRRYLDADLKMSPPQAGKPRVVFMGDSITDFWRLNEYFPDRDFVNRGISGQITGEMLGRMKTDVLDLKPAAVLILAGTNDIGRDVPLNIIENNLVMMADLAEQHHIKVIFSSLLPVSDYHEKENPAYVQTVRRPPAQIRALNSWIQDLCASRNYRYLDYFSETSDASGLFKADLTDDGLHPNSMGYRIMAPLALAAIDSVIGHAPTPVQPTAPRRRLFGK